LTSRFFSRRHILTGAAALSTAAILPRTSLGADWRPTETVRIIVPAAAGGTTDVMGRLLAAHLQNAWASRRWWKTAQAAAAPSALSR
jgi:tripartite-type tricarboxylate transporter receptor subunit TctC